MPERPGGTEEDSASRMPEENRPTTSAVPQDRLRRRSNQDRRPVLLRPATAADLAFCYRVHRAAMRPVVEAVYGWDDDWQARHFQERFKPEKLEIIRHEGLDVGILSVEEQDQALYLRLIAILPAYQNRGIGTRLIRRLQARAEGRGIPLRLQVLKPNRARALYERLGFVLTGETETHYQMRRAASDALQTS